MENWLSGEKLQTQVSVRRQSKTLLTIDKRESKLLETVFLIAICHQWETNGNQKSVSNDFLSTSIVLTFSIAAYPV